MSQLIAAIDWVVQHRRDNGLNIRVLNLSLGTDSVQSYSLDPLMYAAEVAWRQGIAVVVAAGKQGTTRGRLDNPAADPFLLAVGASDTLSTADLKDDQVAEFSSRGNNIRNPDLVAPGRSVAAYAPPAATTTPTTRPRSWPTGSSAAAAAPRPPRWSPGRPRCCCSSAPR